MLYLHREQTEQHQLLQWVSVPPGQQVTPYGQGRAIWAVVERLWPLPGRTDITERLTIKTNFKQRQKSILWAWDREDILKQGEKLGGTGYVDSLSLCKEVFQAQGPLLAEWGLKDYGQETALPSNQLLGYMSKEIWKDITLSWNNEGASLCVTGENEMPFVILPDPMRCGRFLANTAAIIPHIPIWHFLATGLCHSSHVRAHISLPLESELAL